VIRESSYASVEPSLEKLAILPLFASRDLMSEEGAASIHGFVIEALEERGVRSDLAAVARDVVKRLDATGLLLGEVSRYRGRVGARRAVSQPASVAFELALYEVPSGRRLWSGWFDETQQALGESPRERVRLPGGGLRWLTAGELARWGAGEMIKAMLSTR
jgi:hypothetical protein